MTTNPWSNFGAIEANKEDGIKGNPIHSKLSVTTNGSVIRVKGLKGTGNVRYVTIDGKQLGTSRIIDGESMFKANLPKGSTIIISIQEGSIKTILR